MTPDRRAWAERYRDVPRLQEELASKGDAIRSRLSEFRRVGRGSDRRLFEELCFCFLAIQTSARAADSAVGELVRTGLLWDGDAPRIARRLRHRVRFHNHKAAYIVRARERFFSPGSPSLRRELDRFEDPHGARAWLVREVDGLGMKEASHVLRNIGRGDDLAILDRHVLRNLARHGVIDRIPASLTSRRYLEIERKMARFAESVGTSLAVLDLLFWSRETGEIFK